MHCWTWLEHHIALQSVPSDANPLRTFPLSVRRTLISSLISAINGASNVDTVICDQSQLKIAVDFMGAAFDLPFTSSEDSTLISKAISIFKKWLTSSSSSNTSPSILPSSLSIVSDIILYSLLVFSPRTDSSDSDSSLELQHSSIVETLSFYRDVSLFISPNLPSSPDQDNFFSLLQTSLLHSILTAVDLTMRLDYSAKPTTNSSISFASKVCPTVLPVLFDLFLILKVNESQSDLWTTLSRILIAFRGGPRHSPSTTSSSLSSSNSRDSRDSDKSKGWTLVSGPGARQLVGQVWSIVLKSLVDCLISCFPSSSCMASFAWPTKFGIGSKAIDVVFDELLLFWLRCLYVLGDVSSIHDGKLLEVVYETLSSVVDRLITFNRNQSAAVFSPNNILKIFGPWCWSLILSPTTVSQQAKAFAIKLICSVFVPQTNSSTTPTIQIPLFIQTVLHVLSLFNEDLPVRTILSFVPAMFTANYLSTYLPLMIPLSIVQGSRHLGLLSPPTKSPSHQSIRLCCVSIFSTLLGKLAFNPFTNAFECPLDQLALDGLVSESGFDLGDRKVINQLWTEEGVNNGVSELVAKVASLFQSSNDGLSVLGSLSVYFDGLVLIQSSLISLLKMERNIEVLLASLNVVSQFIRVVSTSKDDEQSIQCNELVLSLLCSLMVLFEKRPTSWDGKVYTGVLDCFQSIRPSLPFLLKLPISKEILTFLLLRISKVAQDPPPYQQHSNLNFPIHVHALRTLDLMLAWPELSFSLSTDTNLCTSLLDSVLYVGCSYAKVEDEPVTKKGSETSSDKGNISLAGLTRCTAQSLLSTVLSVCHVFKGIPATSHLLLSYSKDFQMSLSSDVTEVDLLNYLTCRQQNLLEKDQIDVDLRGLLRFFLVNDDVILTVLDSKKNESIFLIRTFANRFCWKLSFCTGETGLGESCYFELPVGKLGPKEKSHSSNLFKSTLLPSISNHFQFNFDLPNPSELIDYAKSFSSNNNFPLMSQWARCLSQWSESMNLSTTRTSSFKNCTIPIARPSSHSNITSSRMFMWLLDLLQPEPFFFSLNTDVKFARSIRHLDVLPDRECAKIGVVYVGEGQVDQNEILANDEGSELFNNFLYSLGVPINIASHTGFLGGLDRYGITGNSTIYYCDAHNEVVFHVNTLMPTNVREKQQIHKKKHIGNDFVHIVFNESGGVYSPNTITSQFNFVHLVVTPITPQLVKINIYKKDDSIPHFGPLYNGAVVPLSSASDLVRETALNANRVVRITNAGFRWPFLARRNAVEDIAQKHLLVGEDSSTFGAIFGEASGFFVGN
ncbi:hypothetical protein P9112_011159 [Eukaryota sp. TZLM1-RC]